MIREEGLVVFTNGSITKIETGEKAACSSCSAHNICGPGSGGKRVVEVMNNIGAKPGQKVIIEMESSSLLLGSLVVFLIPLAMIMFGILTGYFAGLMFGGKEKAELSALLSGAVAFIISAFIVKRISKKLDSGNKFYPEIVEIIE